MRIATRAGAGTPRLPFTIVSRHVNCQTQSEGSAMMTDKDAAKSTDKRVLVASFDTPDGANTVAKQLHDMEKHGALDVENTVMAIKNDKGKVEVKDMADHSVGDGAKVGAVAGGVIGLLFPPSILASTALGGLVGGLAGKVRGSHHDEGLVRDMTESMQPGTSMLVTVVAPRYTDEVEFALAGVASKFTWVEMDKFAQTGAQPAGDEGSSTEAS